ncbi:MAG TPA: polyprenyl synthetase family protein [Candidatus Bacteroides avicola]|uniref:Polyprenyl synthetase family protein n=1 Tax=Candidatus Bacteroides avicola TaxID=2838468 RepID=A0A9D2KW75_9BACE|nr:polyprenyl synthetase family protein [Mediterranea sp. An20]MBW9202371.1 polyprenyl synthetase family protein [Bacteroidales bacterium SW292]OUP06761.1 octaprenyl-diphosphate synthase [Mediterranea sp. An20]HJA86853.1 polyprenyl synthetase family protein [Candidatus Bacteroides avicola]
MDRSSLINAPIIGEMEDFKRLFDSSLSSSNLLLQHVIEHIRHKTGKMMRPMLVLLSAKLLGGEVRPATLHAAAALELLHTASLVHDDVVDESTERRGQLSVNAVFNNKVAVLSGDFLLATALLQAAQTRHIDIIDLISVLGRDLADGELLQLSNVQNREFSEEIYFQVIRKKTAMLFAACTKAGALSVDADEEKTELLRLFGEYIGLCFQIKDDIFDYFDSKEIGKPTGNDMLEGKLTLPVLYALNSTHDAEATAIALRVKNGKATPDEISRLVAFTKEKGGIEYAQEVMDAHRQRALSLLDGVPDCEVKRALQAYIDYVVEREK